MGGWVGGWVGVFIYLFNIIAYRTVVSDAT